MSTENDLYTKIGKLEAELKDSLRDRDMMRQDVKDIKRSMEEDVRDIKKAVHDISLVLAERKGGTKYLFVVLTVAAAIGGLIDRLLTWGDILPK